MNRRHLRKRNLRREIVIFISQTVLCIKLPSVQIILVKITVLSRFLRLHTAKECCGLKPCSTRSPTNRRCSRRCAVAMSRRLRPRRLVRAPPFAPSTPRRARSARNAEIPPQAVHRPAGDVCFAMSSTCRCRPALHDHSGPSSAGACPTLNIFPPSCRAS